MAVRQAAKHSKAMAGNRRDLGRKSSSSKNGGSLQSGALGSHRKKFAMAGGDFAANFVRSCGGDSCCADEWSCVCRAGREGRADQSAQQVARGKFRWRFAGSRGFDLSAAEL